MSISRTLIPLEKAIELEERKVAALENIADSFKTLETISNSLDSLSLWFEEVDKDEWSERLQFYLSEFHKLVPEDK